MTCIHMIYYNISCKIVMEGSQIEIAEREENTPMTEQKRMKAGYLWVDDKENMALQEKAKGLVEKFNALPP